MIEHNITQLNNFIGAWTPSDTSVCDKLIEYHKSTPDKWEGARGGGHVDKTRKDSTDCWLTDPELFREYNNYLQLLVTKYVEKYPWSNHYAPWKILEHINIQHYKPNGGYFVWHTERCSTHNIVRDRHLVFMTYLNDVEDGGETEWGHQNLRIKPEKGLTVIWPADWTFTHRGLPSPTQDKYIITGWFNYIDV